MPTRTVRLRLTVLYSGLFVSSGAVLLAITYVLVRRSTRPDLVVRRGPRRTVSNGPRALREALANPAVDSAMCATPPTQEYNRNLAGCTAERPPPGAPRMSGVALAIMTIVSIALGWLVAGRVLHPLRAMTATTRQISERNLNERLALSGPRDELKDLADTIDGLLARLEAHVAEQQRFAANASHELRTPLALTQTLLEVARNNPNRDDGELVERLHEVNTRAVDLTEALLLLSRAGQRSFTPEPVDLSLMAEEATETLIPIAETRGVTIETSGDDAPTIGSHALLLQLTTNLVHNAIVHNLTDQGRVWVTTSVGPEGAVLTVENTGGNSRPRSSRPSASRFSAAPSASGQTTRASASAWRSSRASSTPMTEPSPSPGPPAGSRHGATPRRADSMT